MPSLEVISPNPAPVRESFPIDAEGLVRELQRPRLPHDPEIRQLENATIVNVPDCPVCGWASATPRLEVVGSEFRMVECDNCGLGSLHPRPSAKTIASFYPPEYYGSPGAKFTPVIERLVRWAAKRSAKRITKSLPQNARVLDVGCGRGVLLSGLADCGVEAHGFEISETATTGADPRAKIAIENSLEDAGYPEGFFDAVVLCHVLEHLPNPETILQEIYRILKPGGRLVIAVPNFSSWQARWSGEGWFHLDLPRHLFHFTADGLEQFLSNQGFATQRRRTFCLRQNPFGWVQSFWNRRSSSRNTLYNLLKKNTSESSPGRWSHLGWRLAYWLGMPVGFAASVIAALFGQGACVTITANRN